MKEKLLSIGSLMASFLASICCIGTVVFTALGLSGLGFSFIPAISRYKNLFTVLSLLMLGAAHYLMGKNRNTARSTRIILWISTLMSVGMLIYSYLIER